MGGIVRKTLLHKLSSRFSISPDLDSPRLVMGEQVFPITDADELLKKQVITKTSSTVSSDGSVTHITVPAGKRYTLLTTNYDLGYTSAAYVRLLLYDGVNTVVLDKVNTPLVSTQLAFDLSKIKGNIVLEPGWILQINHNTVVGSGTVNITSLYYEEDAF